MIIWAVRLVRVLAAFFEVCILLGAIQHGRVLIGCFFALLLWVQIEDWRRAEVSK